MIEKNIKFICQRELPILFSSLVINVESIEKLYPEGFKGFFLSDDFHNAYTNGFIVVFSEMMGFPAYLYSIIDKLQPLGFKEGDDYVIGMEEMAVNIDGGSVPNHSIKWCEKANWLKSIISSGLGNQVWHTSFQKEQDASFKTIEDKEYPWCQYWRFWYDKHAVLRHLQLKKIFSDTKVMRIDESRCDLVNETLFAKHEPDRIPLLLGSQFGISPRLENAFAPDYSGFAAVLGKSMLSGVVAGISIFKIENMELGEKLLFLKNWTGINQHIEEIYSSTNN